VVAEVDPEHLRDGEDNLAMGDLLQDPLPQQLPELKRPALAAARAEMPGFATQCKEKLVVAAPAFHPGEPIAEDAAGEILPDHLADHGAPAAVSFLVPGRIHPLELIEVGCDDLIEIRPLGVPGAVDGFPGLWHSAAPCPPPLREEASAVPAGYLGSDVGTLTIREERATQTDAWRGKRVADCL